MRHVLFGQHLRLRPLRPRADRRRHGPAPRLRRAQPGRARARPRPRRRRLLGAGRRACSSPGCSSRRSANSCCAPRSATPGATALLALALGVLYRRGRRAAPARPAERRSARRRPSARSRGRPRPGRRAPKIAEPATNTFAPAAATARARSRRRSRRRPRPRRLADDRAHARQLLERVRDERLPAPAGVDRHAQRHVDRARDLRQARRRACRG